MERILEDTEPCDLAGNYRLIAEKIGVRNAYELYCCFHGLQIQFPQRFFSNECIERRMSSERSNGVPIREIAIKYNYSESRVQQILRKCNNTNIEND